MSNHLFSLEQVLMREYSHFHGSMPTVYLKDPARWLTQLQLDWVKSKSIVTYLSGKFSDELQQEIKSSTHLSDESPKRDRLHQELYNNFYSILRDPNLYRGGQVTREELAAAVEDVGVSAQPLPDMSVLPEDRLMKINRYLFDSFFPGVTDDIKVEGGTPSDEDIIKILHQRKHSALCLSGGGIRSGTFALGLIQGFARHNLLKEFDYLSTVSGGGYIGSWLTAWIHRHPKGLEGVTEDLANPAPQRKIDPDPAPIGYLRDYSSFITPKVGLLTADTWTFIAIYLRNIFLNWSVFLPLLLCLLLIPRILLAITLIQPEEQIVGTGFQVRDLFLLFGFGLGVWALAYIIFNRPGARQQLLAHRPKWEKYTSQGGFLRLCLRPLIIAAFCLTTYWAWLREAGKTVALEEFLIFGLLFTLFAWLIAYFILGRLFKPRHWNWYEILALTIAGISGGFIFWLLSLSAKFGSPVIGYKQYEESSAYLSWSSWDATSLSTSLLSLLQWKTELYVCFAVPIFMLVFLLGATLFVGVSSFSQRIDDEDREWWARLGAWVFIAIIGWLTFTTLVIYGPIALLSFPKLIASVGGLSGLIAVLVGRSSKSAAQEKSSNANEKTKGGGVGALFMGPGLTLLGLIFIASLLASLSLATTGIIQGLAFLIKLKTIPDPLPTQGQPIRYPEWTEWLTNVPEKLNESGNGFYNYLEFIYPHLKGVDVLTTAKIVHMNVLHHTSLWLLLVIGAVLLVLGIGLARVINLNLFSLHAGYRNRLIRAFLGASRPDNERKSNPFTGFDPADNIQMHELQPGLLGESDFIKPVQLAAELQNEGNRVSAFLLENNLLTNVQSVPNDSETSPRLTAALRKDLNAALESDSLYQQSDIQALLTTEKPEAEKTETEKRATRLLSALKDEDALALQGRGSAPWDSKILLNRLVLEQAYPDMIRPCTYPLPPFRLMHIINTTLNLVGGDKLAWQQRKAEPFSISPLHCGCFRPNLGYRDSREYGGRDTGGISLGTAAAISGAAASSNMGYYTTSPIISLLLTLFNVRLGWWLGNPGKVGDDTYYLRAPKNSVTPVIHEAFGLTNDKNKYIYLTDGGHFENLALYEMVIRRCHTIIVVDGAQDEEYRFSDLGNAVRKIRIDLGVPIEFSTMPIYPSPPENGKGMYWALGTIRYTCIDKWEGVSDGILLYIKPAIYEDEPRDILEYRRNHPSFPHQSTADQFFDEPQFESYRGLGSYIADELCGKDNAPLDLSEVITRAYEKTREGAGEDSLAHLTSAIEALLGRVQPATVGAEREKES